MKTLRYLLTSGQNVSYHYVDTHDSSAAFPARSIPSTDGEQRHMVQPTVTLILAKPRSLQWTTDE